MGSNTVRWKIKSIYNWFEKLYMGIRGCIPTTFNIYNNKYEYELKTEIEKVENEENQPFEIYGYSQEYTNHLYGQRQEPSKERKCKSLSHDKYSDPPLFTRNIE
jgi:hypothetical protein